MYLVFVQPQPLLLTVMGSEPTKGHKLKNGHFFMLRGESIG